MTETELLLVGCDSKFIEKNVVNTVEVINKLYKNLKLLLKKCLKLDH